jgi:hypothetical protein
MRWRSLRLGLVLLLWGGTALTDAGTISLVDLPARSGGNWWNMI